MDVTINPDAMFICPNGHLQYNLTDKEKSEQRERGIDPPGDVYEGQKCRNCDERVTLLTTDPKELQQKLATQMMVVSQLRGQQVALTRVNTDYNRISLWMREEYAYEIRTGESQHSGDLSRAVIHYMKIERGRWRIIAARAWRWLQRLITAGGS